MPETSPEELRNSPSYWTKERQADYEQWVEETRRELMSGEWFMLKSREILEEIQILSRDLDKAVIAAKCATDPDFKRSHLEERKKEIEAELVEFYQFYDAEIKADSPPLLRMMSYRLRKIEDLEKELGRISWSLQALDGKARKGNGITDEMIQRAREYPFEKLVEIGRGGMVRCPFHGDKSPSMLIRRGFAYCFGCGRSFNPIDWVMEKEGVDFVEAVRRLQ